MIERARSWTVRLAGMAGTDFQHIVQWTRDQFGETQALVYAETLSMALTALANGPSIPGTKSRDEISPGLFSLHVSRHGRKGRHFVMFRVARGADVIEVLRILHDAMDLPQHLSDVNEEP